MTRTLLPCQIFFQTDSLQGYSRITIQIDAAFHLTLFLMWFSPTLAHFCLGYTLLYIIKKIPEGTY